MKHTYRPDIDGLRAIAVLSVVFYHTNLKWFQGGYVGVDVFFVISGYLITGIILKDIYEHKFSIFTFYERRIRRIFPALFAVIAFSTVISVFLLVPDDLKDFGQSVVATTLFVSNALFLHESGYFDAPSMHKPLLHTWSLAVEEQYYIFYPLVLFLLSRFFSRKHVSLGLICVAVASFVLNLYSVAHYPESTFYLVYTRAWELLTGAIIALDILPYPTRQIYRDLLAALGLIGIGASVLAYSAETLFPGLAALAPTVGAGILIYSGGDGNSFVKQLLSSKVFVFVGLISYSLYLWHWPLLVFAKYFLIRELTATDTAIVLTCIIVCSVLSWRYIERPFRIKGRSPYPNRVYAVSATVMLLAVGIGLELHFSDGLPQRIVSDVVDSNSDKAWAKWTNCQERTITSREGPCNLGAEGVTPTIVLWGDSHARAIASGVDYSASKNHVAGYIITGDACPPLLLTESKSSYYQQCNTVNESIIDYIAGHPEITKVILVARWALYANGTPYKTETVAKAYTELWSTSENANTALFVNGLKANVRRLLAKNKGVVLVEQVPEIGYDVPSAYYVARLTGRNVDSIIAPHLDEYMDRNQAVLQLFAELKNWPGIQVIEVDRKMCNMQRCFVVSEGQSLYRDDDHLSTYGAIFVSEVFNPLFQSR